MSHRSYSRFPCTRSNQSFLYSFHNFTSFAILIDFHSGMYILIAISIGFCCPLTSLKLLKYYIRVRCLFICLFFASFTNDYPFCKVRSPKRIGVSLNSCPHFLHVAPRRSLHSSLVNIKHAPILHCAPVSFLHTTLCWLCFILSERLIQICVAKILFASPAIHIYGK